ncbi:TPA: branched-chain amino acid ABC transporter permease [Salmonella enterica]|nr:branched-chain amino acid ABC transporter permease [Salmonella enterica]
MKHYFSCLKGDTIKAIFLVCLAVGVVGMSYGSLAMAYGFPLWVPFVLSIFVLAGASEFMFIGIVASGGNPLAAAAAGLLVNARHVPFGVTVRDLVGTRAASFFGCHIMNDESVVFGLSQKTPEQRKAAYWLCGLGVALFWPIGTLIGAGVGKLLPAPETIGLDAVFPAILLALISDAATVLLFSVALATTFYEGEHFAGMARVLGVGFAVFLAWRKMPLIVVIIAAAVVTALLRLAGIN